MPAKLRPLDMATQAQSIGSRVVTALGSMAAVVLTALVSVPLTIVFVPLIALVVAARWARGRWLRHRWERTWSHQGKRVLLVYSRSPVWQAHIETTWLPKVGPHAVLVNWSDRSTWSSRALEIRAFRHWAGEREFNPIAICFPERGRVRTIHFWQAFRDWKHGKPHALERAEAELFGFAAELRAREAGDAALGESPCS